MAHKDKKDKKKRKAKKAEVSGKKDKAGKGKKAAAKKADKPKKNLESLLAKTRCTCCGKHCPLNKPKCGKGRAMAKKVAERFE